MIEVKETHEAICFGISSEYSCIDQVVEECVAYLGRKNIDQVLKVRRVIRELLTNAIEHGHHGEAERRISCAVELMDNNLLKIIVQDSGDGFDHRSVNMELPIDPGQIRQRGYPIIAAYSEQVLFNNKGNEVTVLIRVAPETIYDVRTEAPWVILTPSGDMTAVVANKLRQLLNDLADSGHRHFRFDLASVGHMDSVVLSILIVLRKKIEALGDEAGLEIIHANSELDALFRMTCLDKFFTIISVTSPDQDATVT